STDEIEALANRGIDLSAPSGSAGLSALHRATLTGSLDALRTLLRTGADPDASETGARRTPLHFAALRSDAAAVAALVEAGADKEARDSDGRTPLHLSCIVMRPSDPAVPLYLLESGAAWSAADAQGTTALDIAVRYGCAAVVLAIFRTEGKTAAAAAAPPRPSPGNMGLLYEAVRGGDARIVAALVGAGWEAGVPPAACPPPSEVAKPGGKSQTSPPPAPAPPLTLSAPLQDTRASRSSATPAAWDNDSDKSPAQATAVMETLSPLMLAADSGRPDVVKALLGGPQRGFPDAGDALGYTALHFATMRGSVGIAEALLGVESRIKDGEKGGNGDGGGSVAGVDLAVATTAGGADPNVANMDGDTALHIAVATRRTNVGEALLRAGASVKMANRLGHTALHFAAALGLSGFARRLLDCGADVAAVDGTKSAKAVSPRKAPRAGEDHDAMKAKDVAVNTVDAAVPPRILRGTTAAAASAAAAAAARTVTAQRHGADKRRSTRVCATLKAVAPQQEDANTSRPTRVCALRAKAAVSPTASSTPLVSLNARSRSASSSSPKAKFSPKANPNRKPKKEGRTPLHYAAMNGRVEATRVLLEAGAPPAHRLNDRRESPLFVAARNGHAGVVALLLQELGPADVNMPAAEGQTPLSVACANGHAEVVEKLLQKGADISHRDPASHQSSLDLAVSGTACCSSNRSRIVKTLLKSNADPNGGGGGSVLGHSTPLHTACRVGSTVGVDAVEALLDEGADPDAPPPGEGGRRLLRPLH
ncbi:unnamed protein product, partial [Hapterophycus canaliculatus]